MPIDYSKFDRIDDSDEEGGQTSGASRPSAPTAPATAKGTSLTVASPAAPSRPSRSVAAVSSSGRQTLEPAGLDAKLRVVPAGAPAPDLAALAGELGLLGPGHGAPGHGAPAPPQEAPKPGEPQRLCVRSGGRKKIHTTYPDGQELVEEFDEQTDVLLLRKSRRPTPMGGPGEWVIEVGQVQETAFDPHSDLLRASSSNPIFVRKDTPEHLQWRIRNLPYAASVYSVTVDHEKQEIVVRTSNKKYFKRIDVPDLRRLGLALKDELLTWKHQHNTLIISYPKPPEVVAEEQRLLREAERTAVTL